MKTFKQFEITNQSHVSLLNKALWIAQNQTLENAQNFLQERFETAPIKAVGALFLYNLGYKITPLQQRYVNAYNQASQQRYQLAPGTYGTIENEKDSGNYPDDFNPELYDLD